MVNDDRERTPLWDCLIGQSGRVSFHMPGHRQGRAWPSSVSRQLSALDTTELLGTGDLAMPSGSVLEAFRLAANCFGAGRTWFITSGTTTSIMIMLASVLREGDVLLLPRAVHIAVVHAVALLGLKPIFIEAEDGRVFEDGQPDASAYIDSIRRHPEATACLVTYPDYYGRTVDLESIAHVAHEAGMFILVDEAHGAHFAFLPDQKPATALSLGADIVCQSAHKTLAALTPASLLHVSETAVQQQRIDLRRVDSMIRVFQTSSPSFLIAATIDRARAELESYGKERLERLQKLNTSFSKKLPSGFSRVFPKGADPSRLVLDFSEAGFCRKTLVHHLDRAGIDVEMIDISRIVLIPALDQPEEDYTRLLDALYSLSVIKEKVERQTLTQTRRDLSQKLDQLLSAPAAFQKMPREALFGQDEFSAVTPYPPGLPVLWPGEPVREEHRSFLQLLHEIGIAVRGIDLTLSS
ncbi:MAG: aminotransferase class I/II-fold pyridoxal phosphate-dependent enzyme [Clostridiaceae bacterium]|jgi:arginine decarboxylase|nr:aminotransferase class I/II-fold pyridoxal phosphate-dependent enzyme [Clostridiaceae bacterium]